MIPVSRVRDATQRISEPPLVAAFWQEVRRIGVDLEQHTLRGLLPPLISGPNRSAHGYNDYARWNGYGDGYQPGGLGRASLPSNAKAIHGVSCVWWPELFAFGASHARDQQSQHSASCGLCPHAGPKQHSPPLPIPAGTQSPQLGADSTPLGSSCAGLSSSPQAFAGCVVRDPTHKIAAFQPAGAPPTPPPWERRPPGPYRGSGWAGYPRQFGALSSPTYTASDVIGRRSGAATASDPYAGFPALRDTARLASSKGGLNRLLRSVGWSLGNRSTSFGGAVLPLSSCPESNSLAICAG